MTSPPLNLDAVRAAFDATEPFTVGLEEEVLLVDPESHLPVSVAAEVVESAADPRIKPELPASQVEIFTPPCATLAEAVADLRAGRARLADVADDHGVRPVAAAVHPLAPGISPVAPSDRGHALYEEYGEPAARQLVGALQVHVAVGDADRTLAVYNALRGHLPELAALAAAAPFHEGRDTGLASIRPLIAGLLPRQGVPPAIATWDDFLDDLRWGARSTRVSEPRRWWWELRPHVLHGTLEVRVPDVQPTIDRAHAVAATVHALVVHLAARHAEGVALPCPPTWRIAENRWSALRDGPHGTLADLDSGEPQPTADRLHRLLDLVEPDAPGGLDGARDLIRRNTADDLRAAGVAGAVPWLIEAFAG